MSFESLSLDPDIFSALVEMGYKTPTPIQQEAIPLVLSGEDVVGLAETGSGKTAACAIPLCSGIDITNNHIQALILVPTRELALQYATEAQKIGRLKKVKVFALLGGEDMELQRGKLKSGVHLLVATPGRLIDFIYNRAINLTGVKRVALDEADEMLGMGFLEDLEFILSCMIQEHQTLLFSATMPSGILELARKYMKQPKEVSLIHEQAAPKTLKHAFFYCRSRKEKVADLQNLLKTLPIDQALVFVDFRDEAERVYHKLKAEISHVDYLHGGMSQDMRTSVTQKFAKGKIRFLIATDIAARGLDFSRVSHVINLHLPKDKESYLHRSGRTARSGREGTAITLVTSDEVRRVDRFVENPTYLNQLPSPEELKKAFSVKKKFFKKRPKTS